MWNPPRPLSEADQARLTKNLALARELGAEVIATADEDVVRGIVARRAATQRHADRRGQAGAAMACGNSFCGGWFLRRLVEESGDIDIHVVRAEKADAPAATPIFPAPTPLAWKQYLLSAGVVIAATRRQSVSRSLHSIGYRARGVGFPAGGGDAGAVRGARAGPDERRR